MTRDRRLLLLVILLMAYGLFAIEARHRPHENTANDDKHRHRHRHESFNGRRNRHDLADRRSSPWSQELDYEDGSLVDREDQEDEEDDDYDVRPYYERSYPRTSRIAVHSRMFEPRYPTRYHRGGYRGTGWYEEDEQKRRGSPRYAGRSYRMRSERTHHRLDYPRNRAWDYDSAEDGFDYEKPRAYNENSPDGHRPWWKNGRKHRVGIFRRDWRLDGRKRHRSGDSEPSRRLDDWRRSNFSESKPSHSKTDRRRIDSFEDYEYPVDEFDDAENDEDDASKEMEDEDLDEDELDNDFYRSEKKPPLKTYDDIIRRLTSDDPTTPRLTVKRDYRNIEMDRYAKSDGFGNFRHEPKNLTRPLDRDRGKIAGLPYVNSASGHRSPRKFDENLPGKLSSSLVERKSSKNASSLVTKSFDQPAYKAGSKIDDTQPKTKSLEQDYDEYLNTSDNEKEEDLIKVGVEEDTDMQADVTNTVSPEKLS